MSLLDKEPVKRVEENLKNYDENLNIIALDTSARTEVSSVMIFKFSLKFLRFSSTLLTGSLLSKDIFQLKIVSYFFNLIYTYVKNA